MITSSVGDSFSPTDVRVQPYIKDMRSHLRFTSLSIRSNAVHTTGIHVRYGAEAPSRNGSR
ncbi:MAG: hypothetical protein FWH31_06440 [Streptococcaceae bacterium]|nr:hypothetical protein [Streptococcaceae bacterium]